MKAFLDKISSILLVLLLLSAVMAYSGKLFGYELKKQVDKKIVSSIPKPTSEELKQLHIPDALLDSLKPGIWRTADQETVINTLAFAGDITGYGGQIPILIVLDKELIIRQIQVTDNDESPQFLQSVLDSPLLSKWMGLPIGEIVNADAISGATLSSRAIIESLNRTTSSYAGTEMTPTDSPQIGWGKTIGVVLVVVIGIFISFFRASDQRLRIALQIINCIVLGFWCGQFISLSLLTSWIKNGVHPLSLISYIILVAVALLMPFIGKRNYYCTWMCPFGAAQELIGKCRKQKLPLSPRIMKYLRHSREILFMTMLFLMWLGIGTSIIEYEPFSAFLITTASPVVICLALLILILSIFINRPWCRFACPTGQLLTWTQKMK